MKKYILFLIPIFLLISCGSGERSISGSGTSNVVIDLGERQTVSSSHMMSFSSSSISPASSTLPSTVASVRVQVTDGEDGETLVDTTVDVTGQTSVQISVNVPNGNNRVFTVSAYCSGGELLYQGSTTTDLDGSSVTLSVTMSLVSPVSSLSSWTHPTGLTNNISADGYSALDPQVAMDNNGNAIIVWKQEDASSNYQIFKSEYRSGSWSHPSSISDNISPDGQDASSPQVAMDDNGNAVIVWYQSDGTTSQIFKSEYRAGSWTNPAGLTYNISPDGTNANYPQVAMDNNGNTIIVWVQDYTVSGPSKIYKSEYRSESWTHPSLSDDIGPGIYDAQYPYVAMSNSGDAVIAWHQSSGSVLSVYKSEYRSGEWSYPSDLYDTVSTYSTAANYPYVAMDNNGNSIIAWCQNSGTTFSEYRSSGWSSPANAGANLLAPNGDYAYTPYIAMDDNGNAIITWLQEDGSHYQIYKSEYRSGSWTHPSGISDKISLDAQDATYTRVAMDNNGSAIILFHQNDGSNVHVFKSEYRSGSWTHPSGVSDNINPDGTAAYYPVIAMDNNGDAVAAWYQGDGSYNQIFKSEYR